MGSGYVTQVRKEKVGADESLEDIMRREDTQKNIEKTKKLGAQVSLWRKEQYFWPSCKLAIDWRPLKTVT